MNDISCNVCMDLMPMVKDGVASDDSRKAVEEHIEKCTKCREIYGSESIPHIDVSKSFGKIQKRIQLMTAMIMVFGIFFGLSLTAKSGVFYNILIMPVIGLFGYVIFRVKAFYKVPCLLIISHVLINFIDIFRGAEYLEFGGALIWSVIYSFFAVLGVTSAWLFHFAFKKER